MDIKTKHGTTNGFVEGGKLVVWENGAFPELSPEDAHREGVQILRADVEARVELRRSGFHLDERGALLKPSAPVVVRRVEAKVEVQGPRTDWRS